MIKRILEYFKNNKQEVIVITFLLLISAVAHGFNMFHFPYYENDEGVYMSQAWSLVKFGELAPYTYWYDHAPAGWIFIALWTLLTGGFFTFGFSINSGRVFMLLLHVASSLFLYLTARKLTKSSWAGILSVLAFSLTPLGIYFQRRVLLDNIMVFWILLSFFFLVFYKNRLSLIAASALSFGIAVLTKETAVFLIPVWLYYLFTQTHPHHKRFAIFQWIGIMGSIVSIYLLYAMFKGEFFPYGGIFGGSHAHVSLLEALKFQAGRGGGSILDFENGSFWYNFRLWVSEDPFIMYAGIVATCVNLLLGIKHLAPRIAAFLSIAFWFFLMRGGLVIEFYVIPLLPILALNIGVLGSELSKFIQDRMTIRLLKPLYLIAPVSIAFMIISYSFSFAETVRDSLNIYTSDQTTPQIHAVNWILEQNIPDAFYVIDNYGYIDLQEKKAFAETKTEWYWKVDRDPDVKDSLLKADKSNADFIALTPQMKNDIAYSGLGLSLAIWKDSRPIISFNNDLWGVDIWGNSSPERILKSSWQSYKEHFIQSGRVIDPYQNGITTSEGESYALLRSVWMDDPKTFDELWGWTKSQMQQQNGLFTWKWAGSSSVTDNGTATDADTDIALALIFASKKWDNENYLSDARRILNGVWQNEVGMFQETPYILAGNWGNNPDELIINPSYLTPYAYRIFAEVDPDHDWEKVVDSSYDILFKCTSDKLDKEKGGLPPEWCAVDKKTGNIKRPSQEPNSSDYAYNAFRIPWHIALDYKWYQDIRAKNYLYSLHTLGNLYLTEKKLYAAYQHDGSVWENYESVAAYSGDLGYFLITYPELGKDMYTNKILNKFYENGEESYWDDPKNYYTQNWAWFGTALYGDNLPNLWETKSFATASKNTQF
jgi:endo-1,4-beta-D-glucanase Y/4-amino-4-deoxy-L-arabinose transferase-like glycosyltransferase